MSRIRTVKPDFWVSEQVLACSPLTRLLFIGMWNFCDDNGVHPASYVRLKAEIFPGDNHAVEDIKQCIGELILNGLVRQYAVDDIDYWIVTGWKKHQRIDKPTYKYPLPLSNIKKITDASSTIPRALVDNSSITHRAVTDESITDRNGKEGNGKEKALCEVKTSPASINALPITDIQIIFDYWKQEMNHSRAKLDKKRENKIIQAIKLGYSIDELKQAIDGCKKTPFNMGQNDRNQRFDDIELILRDATHIDRFIGNASVEKYIDTNDVMAGVCL